MPKPAAGAKPAGQNTVLALQLEAAIKQARALRDAGKIAEAGALCQRILKADPRHVEALHLMGALALQTDAFDIAIMSFNRALAEKPRSPAILFDLAQALNADGRPAEAISAYRKALTLRPNDVAAYLGLGDAQLDMGNASRRAQILSQGPVARSGKTGSPPIWWPASPARATPSRPAMPRPCSTAMPPPSKPI